MLLKAGTGNGERGTGNGERGTGNGERANAAYETLPEFAIVACGYLSKMPSGRSSGHVRVSSVKSHSSVLYSAINQKHRDD